MLEPTANETRHSGMLLGIAASPGIARGPAFLCPSPQHLAVPRRSVDEGELPEEMERLEAAIREAEQDLLDLQKETLQKLGKKEAEIFEVQILLLHDPTLRNIGTSVSHNGSGTLGIADQNARILVWGRSTGVREISPMSTQQEEASCSATGSHGDEREAQISGTRSGSC
jgi:hypothetical protein